MTMPAVPTCDVTTLTPGAFSATAAVTYDNTPASDLVPAATIATLTCDASHLSSLSGIATYTVVCQPDRSWTASDDCVPGKFSKDTSFKKLV